jgi:hypothetical protein
MASVTLKSRAMCQHGTLTLLYTPFTCLSVKVDPGVVGCLWRGDQYGDPLLWTQLDPGIDRLQPRNHIRHGNRAPCTVTFVLKQAAAEYTPPTVSVAASIKDGSSTLLGSIAQLAMDAPRLIGTGRGAIIDAGRWPVSPT